MCIRFCEKLVAVIAYGFGFPSLIEKSIMCVSICRQRIYSECDLWKLSKAFFLFQHDFCVLFVDGIGQS
jgi:hypothetical protein